MLEIAQLPCTLPRAPGVARKTLSFAHLPPLPVCTRPQANLEDVGIADEASHQRPEQFLPLQPLLNYLKKSITLFPLPTKHLCSLPSFPWSEGQ